MLNNNLNVGEKIEMCQYDTDAPAQGPSSPEHGHCAKMKLKKDQTSHIIIDGIYHKSNLTYIL